jgi:hypothetical protein
MFRLPQATPVSWHGVAQVACKVLRVLTEIVRHIWLGDRAAFGLEPVVQEAKRA